MPNPLTTPLTNPIAAEASSRKVTSGNYTRFNLNRTALSEALKKNYVSKATMTIHGADGKVTESDPIKYFNLAGKAFTPPKPIMVPRIEDVTKPQNIDTIPEIGRAHV